MYNVRGGSECHGVSLPVGSIKGKMDNKPKLNSSIRFGFVTWGGFTFSYRYPQSIRILRASPCIRVMCMPRCTSPPLLSSHAEIQLSNERGHLRKEPCDSMGKCLCGKREDGVHRWVWSTAVCQALCWVLGDKKGIMCFLS